MLVMEHAIKKSAKPIFLFWIISVICYLPVITKGLTNSVDGLWNATYTQAGDWEISLGRWVLPVLDKLRGGYAAEPFSSVIALLLIAVASYLIVIMFTEVNYRAYICGCLISCSTTICCYLSYRFTSVNYALSVLIAVVAARMISRDYEAKKASQKAILCSIALLVICLGIYQANLGCFCVTIIILLLKFLLNGNKAKFLEVLKRTVIAIPVSCILYKIAWDVCLRIRHLNPANYNGADDLSVAAMILGLPKSLVVVYRSWLRYFDFHSGNYILAPIRVLIVASIFVILLVIGIRTLKTDIKGLIVYILLCITLPVGANIAVIIASNMKNVMAQMTAPMMLVLPMLLLLMDGIGIKYRKFVFAVAAILLYGNIFCVGTDIEAISQGTNSSYTIMNNIITTLNKEKLIGSQYKYAIYGNIGANELFEYNELYERASSYAQYGSLMTKPDMVRYTYIGFLKNMGINLDFVNYNEYEEIYKSDLLDKMASFPADDSIVEKDGVVIIKVSEDYKWD